MKKVIGNKVYDSNKAREVGSWTNGAKGGDRMESTLYRKRTGEYFLMKRTGEHESDIGYRNDIIPLELDKARDWAKDHIGRKAFNREFSEHKSDEVVPMTVNVPRWVYMEVKNNATVRGTSMSAEVTRVVSSSYRISLDELLSYMKSEWKVVRKGETLFTSNTDAYERQVASHGLHLESIADEDGVMVLKVR